MSKAAQAVSEITELLFRDDFSALALGRIPMDNSALGEYCAIPLAGTTGAWRVPVNHWSWAEGNCFHVVQNGSARAVESQGASSHYDNRILIAGEPEWADYRVSAALTPLSFEGASPAGGLCGLIARYEDSRTYLALALERDGCLKLLRRQENVFAVLAGAALPFEPGRAIEFRLTVMGERMIGEAGGVRLEACVNGARQGKIGFIADTPARWGPVTVQAVAGEAARLKAERERLLSARAQRAKAYPSMRLALEAPLQRLINGRNLRLADLNGDGEPEIILAQGSRAVAQKLGLTRLTCLSVLSLKGELLWQIGVPDPEAPIAIGDLPFQVGDVDSDGNLEVVCVLGFDLQIRDGKRGKLLWSCETPKTAAVGNDFKEISSSWGAPWGDETLNMNVAQLLLCNTQGRSSGREILVKDDYHHLVVLDPFADGVPLIKHRGTHGHFPWAGDLDGDGCDELVAGYSLLDHDGKRLWSLHLQDHQDAIAVLDPLAPGGRNKRLFFCGGEDGFLIVGRGAEFHTRVQGHAQRMGIARFRADLPGLQIATITFWGNPGILRLHDATGKLLWSREFPVCGGLAAPVNWSGREEELMLYSLAPGSGLLDGHGELVVEAPGTGPCACFDVTTHFSADGRDSLLAWDRERLQVFVPSDGPLTGAVYRPQREPLANRSNYQAYVSLPPGW